MLAVNSKLITSIKFVVSIILLCFVFAKLDLQELKYSINSIPFSKLIILFFLQIITVIIMSFRFRILSNLRSSSINEIYLLLNKINFYNIFVPGKLGELAKINFLKKKLKKKQDIHCIL